MKAILAEQYLYAFGNRATIKKWKYHLHKTKDTTKSSINEHSQDNALPPPSDDDEDVEIILMPPAKVPAYIPQPAQTSCTQRKSTRLTKPPMPPMKYEGASCSQFIPMPLILNYCNDTHERPTCRPAAYQNRYPIPYLMQAQSLGVHRSTRR